MALADFMTFQDTSAYRAGVETLPSDRNWNRHLSCKDSKFLRHEEMEGEINAVLRVKNRKRPFGKEEIEIFLVFLTVTEGASRKASNGAERVPETCISQKNLVTL